MLYLVFLFSCFLWSLFYDLVYLLLILRYLVLLAFLVFWFDENIWYDLLGTLLRSFLVLYIFIMVDYYVLYNTACSVFSHGLVTLFEYF